VPKRSVVRDTEDETEEADREERPANRSPYTLGLRMRVRRTSAASSFALLRFWPSYQKRAEMLTPETVTDDDQAVRPPME
jgi:hypothetical protein